MVDFKRYFPQFRLCSVHMHKKCACEKNVCAYLPPSRGLTVGSGRPPQTWWCSGGSGTWEPSSHPGVIVGIAWCRSQTEEEEAEVERRRVEMSGPRRFRSTTVDSSGCNMMLQVPVVQAGGFVIEWDQQLSLHYVNTISLRK